MLTILGEVPVKCISLPPLPKTWMVDFGIVTHYSAPSKMLITLESLALLLNSPGLLCS